MTYPISVEPFRKDGEQLYKVATTFGGPGANNKVCEFLRLASDENGKEVTVVKTDGRPSVFIADLKNVKQKPKTMMARAGLVTIDELTACSEDYLLENVPQFGQGSLIEVKTSLAGIGRCLAT